MAVVAHDQSSTGLLLFCLTRQLLDSRPICAIRNVGVNQGQVSRWQRKTFLCLSFRSREDTNFAGYGDQTRSVLAPSSLSHGAIRGFRAKPSGSLLHPVYFNIKDFT